MAVLTEGGEEGGEGGWVRGHLPHLGEAYLTRNEHNNGHIRSNIKKRKNVPNYIEMDNYYM